MAASRTRRDRDVLAEWQRADSEIVRLPSLRYVRIRPPEVEDLARFGSIPADLIRVVASASDEPLTADTAEHLADETMRFVDDFARLQVMEVSADGEAWTAIRLDADAFARLPEHDKRALRQIALGQTRGAIVTAYSDFRAGEISEDEAAARIQKEASRTVSGWESFRQFTDRALGRVDGGNVVRPPFGAPPRNRAARRARA